MAFPIALAVIAAAQLAATAYGQYKNSKTAKAQQDKINQREAENQSRYDRLYNEDVTQRAAAQRLLTLTQDAIRQRNKAAEGRAAIMGTTDASVAQEKAENNKILGDVISNINAEGEARKDAVENRYLQTQQGLDNMNHSLMNARMQNTAEAVKGVQSAIGTFGSAYMQNTPSPDSNVQGAVSGK